MVRELGVRAGAARYDKLHLAVIVFIDDVSKIAGIVLEDKGDHVVVYGSLNT